MTNEYHAVVQAIQREASAHAERIARGQAYQLEHDRIFKIIDEEIDVLCEALRVAGCPLPKITRSAVDLRHRDGSFLPIVGRVVTVDFDMLERAFSASSIDFHNITLHDRRFGRLGHIVIGQASAWSPCVATYDSHVSSADEPFDGFTVRDLLVAVATRR